MHAQSQVTAQHGVQIPFRSVQPIRKYRRRRIVSWRNLVNFPDSAASSPNRVARTVHDSYSHQFAEPCATKDKLLFFFVSPLSNALRYPQSRQSPDQGSVPGEIKRSRTAVWLQSMWLCDQTRADCHCGALPHCSSPPFYRNESKLLQDSFSTEAIASGERKRRSGRKKDDENFHACHGDVLFPNGTCAVHKLLSYEL